MKEVADEGWAGLQQSTINQWVESMLKRLQAVIDMNGQMTPF